MENVVPIKIQILTIIASLIFSFFVSRLIIKGKLREEYAIFWFFSTIILIVFSIWRNGLEVMATILGVFEAPNLVFTAAIFAILVYLLHLSVVISKLHDGNKNLNQEIALLKQKLKEIEKGNS
ncbi:MAG: DUF2304 domain-containing protein [Bacteroidales bacterium]|nr:DUF2304 domain-containing protein [Bacteroidales bacterium]